jgi:hypothetical protein
MPVFEQMPATAMRFGRAPGAWPFLGHAVALRRRPLALPDSLPARGDLVVFSPHIAQTTAGPFRERYGSAPSPSTRPLVSHAQHRALTRVIWCGVRHDTRIRSGLATMIAMALAREVATFSRCPS